MLKHFSDPAKLRLVATIVMIVLAFGGVIVTAASKDGAWNYWRALCVIYAVMSLGMSHHLKTRGWKLTALTLWHEVAHWAGLFGAILVTSWLVHSGVMGRFQAGLIALLLLALTTYLAGIYIERTCVVVGIMLALFAAGIAFLDTWLYNILIPLLLTVGVLAFLYLHHRHKSRT